VTGRWPFASNARHAAWMFGGCTVLEGGVPQRDAAGRPRTVVCLFPAEDCVLLDTWLSTGLCGTGSVDFTVEDCFVPARLTFNPATSPLGQAGPLYRLRTMYLVSHGAVVLGIARAAIDATVALMAHKTRVTGTALRDEPYAQMAVAKAEALVASARAYCLAVIEAVWATAMAGDELGLRQRADFRLSILHAHDAATEAIDLLHHVSGGTSAYRSSPLDRPFRDMHAIRQHVVAAPKVQETVGRVYVGLPPDVPFL
jgi:alkylation response protein AidB-like acyl-CoA dehydrogenase